MFGLFASKRIEPRFTRVINRLHVEASRITAKIALDHLADDELASAKQLHLDLTSTASEVERAVLGKRFDKAALISHRQALLLRATTERSHANLVGHDPDDCRDRAQVYEQDAATLAKLIGITDMSDDDKVAITRFAITGDHRAAAEHAFWRNMPMVGAHGNVYMDYMSEVLSPAPDYRRWNRYRLEVTDGLLGHA